VRHALVGNGVADDAVIGGSVGVVRKLRNQPTASA
jgi:hypothetical protein